MNQPWGAKLGRAGPPDQPSGFSDLTTDGTDSADFGRMVKAFSQSNGTESAMKAPHSQGP